MASDVGVGDAEVPTLTVAPADDSTQVTLTAAAPDGTSTPITMTGGVLAPITGSSDQQQTWTATTALVFTQPGTWVLHYTVTGTGQGAEDQSVFVVAAPAAGGPTWLPGLSRVAAYVPHRTLARSMSSTTGSADTYQLTFDSTTVPDAATVSRLISDGADWVSAIVTPMNGKSQPLAALLAALWAAIAVERSWPQDDQALQRANDMEKQLNTLLEQLKTSNTAANTTQGVDSNPPAILPVWSFPYPDQRWDYSRFW